MVVNDANKTKDGRYLFAGIKYFILFYTSLDSFYLSVATMHPISPLIYPDKYNNLFYTYHVFLKPIIKKYNYVIFNDVGKENINKLRPELEWTGEIP